MAKIDNRKIYISYYKGLNILTDKATYTEPNEIYANVGENVSRETVEQIGRIPDYDRTLVIEIGEKTEFVREDSLLWIDTVPNETKTNYDYTIARVGDRFGSKVTIYCNSIAPNTQFLYYSTDNENIYQVKVFYKDLTAIVPKNMYFPITADTKVWFTKPKSLDSTNSLLKLIDTKTNIKTYSYTFEEV